MKSNLLALSAVVAGSLVSTQIVSAQERPVGEPTFYVGGVIGGSFGSGDAFSLGIAQGNLENDGAFAVGILGGVDVALGSGFIIGAEADISLNSGDFKGDAAFSNWFGAGNECITGRCGTNWNARARAKLGYEVDQWTLFATAGIVATSFKVGSLGFGSTDNKIDTGLTFGAGIDYQVNDEWSVRVEYIRDQFDRRTHPSFGPYSNDWNQNTIRVGAIYKF